MNIPEPTRSWEPRLPTLIAIIMFVAAALSLCWPMLQGQFIGGEDQVIAGYSFRLFGAEYFKAHHAIPQWNPYIFGGMPFSAVIGHGDIFYPTAWFRWLVPVDFGMSFGFFFHIALAGASMYALIRGLKMSWVAGVTAGVAYQLSGNLSSMLANGHDGKLFVGALAPFAFLALINAIRHGKRGSYGWLALIIGLAILSPAVQVAYYLMVACGMLALWLVFLDPERRPGTNPFLALSAALGAVFLGLGISMIQIYQILTHVKYTPRAEAGPSTGWDYATSYSFHIKEIPAIVLPQFNGMTDAEGQSLYAGVNSIKSHTEYLGIILVILAILGISAAKKRKLLLPFGLIAGLFLLVSLAADTPFYTIWYNVMPMMDKVRAAGMAFYLVGLCIAVFAACGIDRLFAGEVKARSLYIVLGCFGAIALLGSAGGLLGLAAAFAAPGTGPAVLGSPVFAEALQSGSIRMLLFVLLGAGVLLTIQRGILRGAVAALALTAVVGTDSWSILRNYSKWLPPASVYYADDPVIAKMKADLPMPFRVFDPSGRTGEVGQTYYADMLMAHEVPTLFGYHGMESVWFDELFGTKNTWDKQNSPALWDLYALNYIVINQEVAAPPGYHRVMGPQETRLSYRSGNAFLFQRDTAAPWVRVIPRGLPVPPSQVIDRLVDPTFPRQSYVLLPDSNAIGTVDPLASSQPVTPVKARLKDWQPGAMTVQLSGADSVANWLVVAENWYPDWHATVDGNAVPTTRVNHAMLGVAVPPGAKEVSLVFDVPEYRKGKWISIACTLLALGLIGSSLMQRRMANG